MMMRYGNRSGQSGVVAYQIKDAAMVVEFRNGSRYEYTNASAGPAAVATMKQLAKAGAGLSTFISQHVHDRYARKLR